MFLNRIKYRGILIFMIMFAAGLTYSAEINVERLRELISGQNPQLDGYIRNLQVAPFNNDLVSFEVEDDAETTIKLFLYNISTRNLLQIESAVYSEDTTQRRRYYIQDQGLRWHPYNNWFVFYGNGFQNRNQIYICRVVVPELINNFSVNGYRVILRENLQEERSHSQDPAFDMTGENLFFTRRVEKRDRQARYNRTFNITGIQNIFDSRESRFRGVEFRTVLDKRFNQFMPLPSPSDKDLIAYISYKNQETRGESFYHEYSLNIVNLANMEDTVVDNLDGYQYYPFFWSNTGSHIFYMKALSLLRTPQRFIDDELNQVNLHFARIERSGNTVNARLQNNPVTDILLSDVVAKESWIAFINDDNIIAAKYESDIPVLYSIDINRWRRADRNYSSMIDFDRDFDAENPVLLDNELLFISTSFVRNRTISAIQSATIDIKLEGDQLRDIATRTPEIDTSEIDDGDYVDDTYFDESAAFDRIAPVIDTKAVRIAELEKELGDLRVRSLTIDNQILAEQSNVENLESEIRNMTMRSSELLVNKNSSLARINQLRQEQTRHLQAAQQITLKESEITRNNTEILRIESEILSLENSILAERGSILSLEEQLAAKMNDIVNIRRNIANLRIEQTRTMETENKLASFQEQLDGLKAQEISLDDEISKLEKELSDYRKELEESEKQLTLRSARKELIEESLSGLRDEKIASAQRDRGERIDELNNDLTSLKNDVSRIDGEIETLESSVRNENDQIVEMIEKVRTLNNDKIAAVNSLNQLRTQRAQVAAVEEAEKIAAQKPEEIKDDEEPVYDEYYYDDDISIGDDIFEDVSPSSSRRRGRR